MSNARRAAGDIDAPATEAYTAVPNDNVDLTSDSRAIMCSGDGTVRATFVNNDDGGFVNLSVKGGILYPFRVKRIWATGTDVTVTYFR